MLNKLLLFARQHDMIQPGDTVVCAVSGGADSVALLLAMYLLREKLQVHVEAAHYNHNLRGAESERDAQFVKALCERYDIPLHMGSGAVTAGKKGLEAAARMARYAFLENLPGKIATAHTADDNAETILMHMLRGTGLKGLCGIAPVRSRVIRPMLSVTREDVLAFLEEYHLSFVEDSSNETDGFLRNRLRHHVMPLLREENPRFAQSVTEMAMRLRADDKYLDLHAQTEKTADVATLRKMEKPIQSRVLCMILEESGVAEPSAEHIALLRDVLYADSPSAKADFPGNIKIGQLDGKLQAVTDSEAFCAQLPVPGSYTVLECGVRVSCTLQPTEGSFSFVPCGTVVVRSRRTGDCMRLPGGTKSLKRLFIDRKIPAACRNQIPVVADDLGVIAVYGIGGNRDRMTKQDGSVAVSFEIVKTL